MTTDTDIPTSLLSFQEYMILAKQVAWSLKTTYRWLSLDDLHSYAFLGLTRATKVYRSEFNVPFRNFAWQRAKLLAVDEMRKDGVLIRSSRKRAALTTCPLDEDLLPAPDEDMTTKMELRDLWEYVFSILSDSDRKLLIMYYVSGLSFKQIGEVLDRSESAVCVRYRLLIARLRRLRECRRWA